MLKYFNIMLSNIFVDICLYCNLLSVQQWSRLLSWCCPNNGGGAAKIFQSNRKGMFDDYCSLYRASRLFGKFKGKSVGEI